jgi:AraC-like DNA-binding protein
VSESSLSIRLLWAFARVTSADPELIGTLASHGIGPSEFANPETRLPHSAVMALLTQLVRSRGDQAIGLRAGSSMEHGDFDALEYAARSCADLREAIGCISRYMGLLNEAAEISLHEEGDRAVWRYRITDGVPQPPAANDFVVACAITFARMYADLPEMPMEVHLMHPEATDSAAYAQLFGANVKLGMPHNACVFARSLLARPMQRANRSIHIAFETHAKELAERLRGQQGAAGRVREVVLARLRSGRCSMASVARAMGMSIATLRRRLEEEGTTHSEILDRVRYDLAKVYLSDSRVSVREIAFLLGYSHPKAFYNAFRRWTRGSSPAEYRAEHG